MDTPPAKAAAMLPRKAKELPRKTGLRNFVNKRYTSVPIPAPKSAAAGLRVLPVAALVMTGTTSVAAMMARSCWIAKISVWLNFGLSLTP